MKVLVAYGSRHGATAEIADAVGRVLRERGHDVTVARADDGLRVESFDAVVVGSAIYAGHWLREASSFVERNAGALARRRTWLFSSGPLGDDAAVEEEQPTEVRRFEDAVGTAGHVVFGGRLEASRLSYPDRMVVKAFRAPEGDFRDWAAIRAWADGVASALDTAAPHP